MTIYHFIVKIFNCSLEAIPVLLMYLKLVQKENFVKEHKDRAILYVLISAVFATWARMTVGNGGHTPIIIIFTILVLSIITSTSLKYSFIAIMVSMIWIGVTEAIWIALFSVITGENGLLLLDNIGFSIMFGVTINSVRILMLYLMNKTKKNFINIPFKEEEDNITAYWILGVFIILICLLSVNNILSNKIDIVIYQVLLFLLLIFFMTLGVVDYKKRMELNTIKNKFELKEEYAQNLEAIVEIVRKEKHDFANHINTIYAMCVLNKPDTLECVKKYLKKTTHNLESSYKFFETGNNYIDGLIAMKSRWAFENSIHLDIDFEETLDTVVVDDYELVGIMSNIIDNAFQAFNYGKLTEKKIVSIYGYCEEDKYYLSIANNGPMIPENKVDKIFNKGFTTKKNDKKDHGFGLFIVNNLIKKNGGKIIVSSSLEETEFLLQFERRKEYSREIC